MLLDCGGGARFVLAEQQIYGYNVAKIIDALYISHLHADHIGGIEWLAFGTFFNPQAKKLKLFMEKETMQNLWEHSLKGGLERIDGQMVHLEDYFECHPLAEDDTFIWEGIQCTLVKMLHVNTSQNHYSYGLLLRETEGVGTSVFISTDTMFLPDLITQIAQKADVIFHDCETNLLIRQSMPILMNCVD